MYKKIKLKKGSHFICGENEIIFIDGYDKSLTGFVEDNMQHLRMSFEKHGLNFVYLPFLVKEIANSSKPKYYAPHIDPIVSNKELTYSISDYTKEQIEEIDFNVIKGAFICSTTRGTLFMHIIEQWDSLCIERSILDFSAYCSKIDRVKYSTIGLITEDDDDTNSEDYADNHFNSTVIEKLSDEIRAKVKELRSYGVSEYIIQSLFKEKQKLSRLVITSDYKIMLPDYDNMEIKMEPLPKSIYILFLRHPEGIRFKELPQFRDEVAEIYMGITKRLDLDAIYKSIDTVLDPTKNSINEKCSRIREAFISRFDDRLAKNYYITGVAGLTKKISLKIDLITM